MRECASAQLIAEFSTQSNSFKQAVGSLERESLVCGNNEQTRPDTNGDHELVERFVAIGIEQDDALNGPGVARYNKLFKEETTIIDELKRRDRQTILLPLYDHENMQVRLNAAQATLAVAPVAARQQLEMIRASAYQPQTGDAGMAIQALDEGIYKPE